MTKDVQEHIINSDDDSFETRKKIIKKIEDSERFFICIKNPQIKIWPQEDQIQYYNNAQSTFKEIIIDYSKAKEWVESIYDYDKKTIEFPKSLPYVYQEDKNNKLNLYIRQNKNTPNTNNPIIIQLSGNQAKVFKKIINNYEEQTQKQYKKEFIEIDKMKILKSSNMEIKELDNTLKNLQSKFSKSSNSQVKLKFEYNTNFKQKARQKRSGVPKIHLQITFPQNRKL